VTDRSQHEQKMREQQAELARIRAQIERTERETEDIRHQMRTPKSVPVDLEGGSRHNGGGHTQSQSDNTEFVQKRF
jgi:hypothetical protein